MKIASLLLAALLGNFVPSAQAERLFIGVNTSLVSYPNWASTIDNLYYAAGANSSSSTQNSGGTGHGIRGGIWLNENFGLEIGYDNLGFVQGTTTVYFGPIMGRGSWEFAARARHVGILGGIKFGRSTLSGKVGIQHATTTLSGTYVNVPRSASHTGGLFGAEYSFHFTKHIALSCALNAFRGVRFPDYSNNTGTTSTNLRTIAIGVDYTF